MIANETSDYTLYNHCIIMFQIKDRGSGHLNIGMMIWTLTPEMRGALSVRIQGRNLINELLERSKNFQNVDIRMYENTV